MILHDVPRMSKLQTSQISQLHCILTLAMLNWRNPTMNPSNSDQNELQLMTTLQQDKKGTCYKRQVLAACLNTLECC